MIQAFENYKYMTRYKELVESSARFIQSFLYVRCINRKSLVMRSPEQLKARIKKEMKAKREKRLQELGLKSKPEDNEQGEEEENDKEKEHTKESQLIGHLKTEELLDMEKEESMKNQGFFNQLSINHKRAWYGRFRKDYVDFKTRRK